MTGSTETIFPASHKLKPLVKSFLVEMTVLLCLKEILIILPTNSESEEEGAPFIICKLFSFNAKFSWTCTCCFGVNNFSYYEEDI